MIAHAAREGHALLFKLVEKHLHALSLAGDFRRRHDARRAVGVDQAELSHAVAAGVLIDDAGHTVVEHVPALGLAVPDQHAGRPAAVSGDDDVVPVLARPHADGLLQSDQFDVGCEVLQIFQGVEVVRVRIQLVQRQVDDLLLFGLRCGALQHARNVISHSATNRR